MKSEEIIKIVEKVWRDDTDSVSISRGWMSHHQVIASALEMDGDNAYLKNRGGLDFGVRMSFHANRDNTGADRIIKPVENASAAEIIAKEMKYNMPKIETLIQTNLSKEENEFFFEYLDGNKMTNEVVEYWLSQEDNS